MLYGIPVWQISVQEITDGRSLCTSAPDIFQSIMDELLGDLSYVRTYIDDILICSDGNFEDHMAKLSVVLDHLEKAGFRANMRKCFYGRNELEYLGYQLTRDGIQPQPKKWK